MKLSLMALTCGFFLAVALPMVAFGGPEASGDDVDMDGVDDAFDNCTDPGQGFNPDQADADHDGCGDVCDLPGGSADISCDFTGDGAVGVPDFIELGGDWGCDGGCAADCTGDDAVGVPDFLALGQQWGRQIGPSGITTANRDPVECPGL